MTWIKLALVSSIAMAPLGCSIELDPIDCNVIGIGDTCVDANHPLDFSEGIRGIAIGAEVNISVHTLDSIDQYQFWSSDSSILEIELVGDSLIARAVGAGTVQITANAADDFQTLDSISIVVAPIANATFRYMSGGQGALDKLAGITDTSDNVFVAYTSSGGQVLATGDLVDMDAEGSVVIGGQLEQRHPVLFGRSPSGKPTTISFLEEGSGSLIARTEEQEFIFPIEVVTAPDSFSIVTGTTMYVDQPALVLVDGRTSDNTPVAGLRGTWSVAGSAVATVETLEEEASEAVIVPSREGSVVLSVVVNGEMSMISIPVEVAP